MRRHRCLVVSGVVLVGVVVGLSVMVIQARRARASAAADNGDMSLPAADWNPDTDSLGGYTSQACVTQGEDIGFHISTDLSTYSLTVWREGATRQEMTTTQVLAGGQYPCTEGYQPPGCGWPVAYTLTVPAEWPSGVYTVDVPTNAKGDQYMVFWVREDNPGSVSPILFLGAVNTYNAYTDFGGKSIYNFNSSDNAAADKVSFNRPFRNNGWGDFAFERPLLRWAESRSYTMEYGAESDLAFIPDLLDPYEVVVIAGHGEYWSWDMRQRLKAFIGAGGRLINLSGNTMWWQVRYEDGGRTLVGYKEDAYTLDPEFPNRQLTTYYTWDYPVSDMETSITGASWLYGGYFDSPNDRTFTHADGYGGYWVQRADHWVFEGTGLQNGDVFGRTSTDNVLGEATETDGTSFNCAPDGRTLLGPLANTGTPYNFTILGYSPAALDYPLTGQLGFAMMGIYTLPGGGAVFSANTIGWVSALDTITEVSQVTGNVFDRFLANDFPQEPVSSADTGYFFYDRFNCDSLDHSGVEPSYSGPTWYEGVPRHNYFQFYGKESNLRYTDACGVDGAGLEITIDGSDWISYQSQVKPNWEGSDLLYTRMYLDFTTLVLGEGNQFLLLSFVRDSRTAEEVQANLHVERDAGETLLVYEDEINSIPISANVPTDQPFVVETMWDKSGNQISLWIDGVRYDQSTDLSTAQQVNRVDLMVEPWGLGSSSGSFCVDEFAFDDQRIGPLDYGLQVSSAQREETTPGSQVTFTHTLTNTGTASDSFTVTATIDQPGWTVEVPPGTVGPLVHTMTDTFTATVSVPLEVPESVTATVTITATSVGQTGIHAEVVDLVAVEIPPVEPDEWIFLPVVLRSWKGP